ELGREALELLAAAGDQYQAGAGAGKAPCHGGPYAFRAAGDENGAPPEIRVHGRIVCLASGLARNGRARAARHARLEEPGEHAVHGRNPGCARRARRAIAEARASRRDPSEAEVPPDLTPEGRLPAVDLEMVGAELGFRQHGRRWKRRVRGRGRGRVEAPAHAPDL